MAYTRKTQDVWRIYVNYGQGYEHECTELTRAEMKANVRAYRDNCGYPVKVVKGRDRIVVICPQCSTPVWDIANGPKLNKCWNCMLAFD